MQWTHPLPNGCQATKYAKRAMQFLIHMKPNLPQQYTAHDVSDYLVDLMPKAQRMKGRGIAERHQDKGQYLDQLAVLRRCRKAVYEEQDPSTSDRPLALWATARQVAQVCLRVFGSCGAG